MSRGRRTQYPPPRAGDVFTIQLRRGNTPLFWIEGVEIGEPPAFPIADAEAAVAAAWRGSERKTRRPSGRPKRPLDLALFGEHLRGKSIRTLADATGLDERMVTRQLADAKAFLKACGWQPPLTETPR